MDDIEIRELRYFAAVAEELHFGRAAQRLHMSQPPLSRAIQLLEQRLGVDLFHRDRRGVRLTPAGAVLLEEAGQVLDAAAAAVERTRRTVDPAERLVLVTKAGASHELLRALLDTYAARPDALPVEVVLCEVGEQRQVLRRGRADVAIVHSPYDVIGGFETRDLVTEGQVAIVPEAHPLALRPQVALADVSDVAGLPIARWPRHDGSYPPGPGPEVRTQSELAQLVSLGRTLLVIPESSRAWQWPDHVAVPVLDAPLVTTKLAWRASSRPAGLDSLLAAAGEVADRLIGHPTAARTA
ncbi:LysR family transcriptional regulator [Nocardioides sp. cx-173]|uniref:LysR family transcriptional regulator n=1 Tax=Nocardioides sp. cx-173 TaxID=2898796 RepID=UPI001E410060|nr:LysR family transcriptional regulator [Nocardioides sp. cx-173]MCD4525983.1 LysR family transcriptional regulator [Nocardioides sp. cx-173]UGB43680.1 LysR family transcriptional regulator [Nocardioides sp. cx-173]